jgi:hypothetical protein
MPTCNELVWATTWQLKNKKTIIEEMGFIKYQTEFAIFKNKQLQHQLFSNCKRQLLIKIWLWNY